MTIIGYLKENLGIDGDFMREYKSCSMEDKQELKEWAREEMKVLGIEIEEK
jgi:hypothetical protein